MSRHIQIKLEAIEVDTLRVILVNFCKRTPVDYPLFIFFNCKMYMAKTF